MTDTPGTPLTHKIASTRYEPWIEIECVQMCGWKAPQPTRTSDAVKHVKATGHETAVKHHSSIHYHPRRDDDPEQG